MMENELILNMLKDMVYKQSADKIWNSANQLLLFLTNEKEGQGKLNIEFIKKYKEKI